VPRGDSLTGDESGPDDTDGGVAVPNRDPRLD
jgi:hypothetical protein